MNNHSKLPPSSAARRMTCPGSREFEERYGHNEKTEASEEGDLAHELAARTLRHSNINGMLYLDDNKYTQEMYDGAQFYTDIVARFLSPGSIHIEERIDCSKIHPAMWGTADAWGIEDDTLHVFDYKFGFTPVEVYENWQVLAYACGIAYSEKYVNNIYLHIVQPRDYISDSRHKVWNLTAVELLGYYKRLVKSEALAMSPSPELKISDQCKYCSARHACPALRRAAFGATEVSYRDIPQGLTPSQVGRELKLLHDAREVLEYRITALETEAQHLLQAGQTVDNYELATTQGRMTWAVDKEEVINLGTLFNVELVKTDVLTPAQAIKAGLSEETVLKYSQRKQSLKLSKIDVNKAKAVFGKSKQTNSN